MLTRLGRLGGKAARRGLLSLVKLNGPSVREGFTRPERLLGIGKPVKTIATETH